MQIGRSDRGEPSRVSKISVQENKESFEVSRDEEKEIARRFNEIDKKKREMMADASKEIEKRYPEMGEIDKYLIAHFATGDWHEREYRKIINEFDLEDDYIPLAHQRHDWASANDLTYSFSDLETNPKTGNTMANDIKKHVAKLRSEWLEEMEKFVKENLY